MEPTKATPLRVGVLGLGPLWRSQYRPALRAVRDLFQVVAVCDQIQARAIRTAKRLRCAPAAGPTDLCGRADVEALLLLDAQWYGLWPLGLACRLGKPLFCCLPPQLEADAGTLLNQLEAAGVCLVPALPLRVAPMTGAVLELFATGLGSPRRVVCVRGGPGSASVLDHVDWCSFLFGGWPLAVRRISGQVLNCLELDYGEGRSAQLIDCPELLPRLEVFTAGGRVAVSPPGRLRWSADTGRHARLLPHANLGALMLQRFHQTVVLGEKTGPHVVDLLRLQEQLGPCRREPPASA